MLSIKLFYNISCTYHFPNEKVKQAVATFYEQKQSGTKIGNWLRRNSGIGRKGAKQKLDEIQMNEERVYALKQKLGIQ